MEKQDKINHLTTALESIFGTKFEYAKDRNGKDIFVTDPSYENYNSYFSRNTFIFNHYGKLKNLGSFGYWCDDPRTDGKWGIDRETLEQNFNNIFDVLDFDEAKLNISKREKSIFEEMEEFNYGDTIKSYETNECSMRSFTHFLATALTNLEVNVDHNMNMMITGNNHFKGEKDNEFTRRKLLIDALNVYETNKSTIAHLGEIVDSPPHAFITIYPSREHHTVISSNGVKTVTKKEVNPDYKEGTISWAECGAGFKINQRQIENMVTALTEKVKSHSDKKLHIDIAEPPESEISLATARSVNFDCLKRLKSEENSIKIKNLLKNKEPDLMIKMMNRLSARFHKESQIGK